MSIRPDAFLMLTHSVTISDMKEVFCHGLLDRIKNNALPNVLVH